MRKKIKSEIILVVAFIATYCIWGLIFIDRPGPYYDELFWLNASLGMPIGNNFFVTATIGKVPIMVMPYIGALKSFVYSIPFYLFGTSVKTLRVTAIILGGVSLLLTYLYHRKAIGAKFAFLVCMLLSIDASYIFTTRLDWGPVTLMFICKAATYLFFYCYLDSKKSRYLYLCGLTLFIGIYDKANFVWFFLAFLVSSVFVYAQELLKIFKENIKKNVCIYGFLGILTLIIFITYLIPLFTRDTKSDVSVMEHVLHMLAIFKITLDGQVYTMFFTGYPRWKTLNNIFFVIAFIVGIILSVHNIKDKKYVKESKFLLNNIICIVLMVIMVCLTKSSGGIHHTISIYPLPYSIIVLSFYLLAKKFSLAFMNIANICYRAILLIIGVFLILNLTCYEAALINDKSNDRWSMAMYDLAEYIEIRDPDYIVCADWGFANQLLLLLPENQKTKIRELLSIFNEPDSEQIKWLKKEFLEDNEVIIIYHANEKENIITNSKVEKTLELIGEDFKYREISDKNGPIYNIVEFAK